MSKPRRRKAYPRSGAFGEAAAPPLSISILRMLEVPAFVIGLSGLLPLIEKSLQLWQSISEANAFGSDLMGLVAQLSSEYSRFLLWARVSGVFEPPASGSPPQTLTSHPTSTSFPFPEDLGARLSHQLRMLQHALSQFSKKYLSSLRNTSNRRTMAMSPPPRAKRQPSRLHWLLL